MNKGASRTLLCGTPEWSRKGSEQRFENFMWKVGYDEELYRKLFERQSRLTQGVFESENSELDQSEKSFALCSFEPS